ncbi:ZN598 ligase, partial [Polyodon spathula]|nr:ZN598 ligase [Polyodon spathula]
PVAAMASKPGKDTERSCVLCCQEIEIFALGKCDHPVCYRCSTKMRVLCEQKYCAVCREELDKVLFVKKLDPFSAIATQHFQCEKKHDIYFSDADIHTQFRRILQHECPQCPELRVFSKFEELEQHMRKQHELFCCKLCAKHLQIFTHEREWYNRKELARHRTQGDLDDTSHRGHPLCKFCDDRYLDNDELLKHLRRDHYFCHFCDSDGAQEYYSDYDYLREHFREKHYLCEEGRCSAEQFTHAFRTEIDYKAHKAACHSKSRAEARQNRHIDLQFNYASRHSRRSEGVLGGEDYEEVDRFNRHSRAGRGGGGGGGRGGQQNRRGSWRYNREEEDREVAAAVRASVAARRQEEKRPAQEREISKPKEEAAEAEDLRHARAPAKPASEAADAAKPASSNGPLKGEDFPALGVMAAPIPRYSTFLSAAVKLKEDDFPSLLSKSVSSPMTPAYTALPRKPSAFQEEDFPALVSKIRAPKQCGSATSAWSTSSNKNKPSPAASPFPSFNTPTPSSSATTQPRKKPLPASSNKSNPRNKSSPASDEDDDRSGKTTQEIRSIPTMLDISCLLTGRSAPQTVSKVGKRKMMGVEKQSPAFAASPSPVTTTTNVTQKENVPESKQPPQNITRPASNAASKTNLLINGHSEQPAKNSSMQVTKEPPGLKKQLATLPCPLPEEEFPALLPKKPPPGFNTAFPMKGGHSSLPPPPHPGLAAPPSNPPPGFTGIALSANVLEPAVPTVNEPALTAGTYLVPQNFQLRNMELIQSIKNFLLDEESKFNQFKTFSGQFRQGHMSAVQYHQSCRELLGENFKRIFNELLVLLPDTSKQQELLAAHNQCQASNKPKKNKKNAWQTGGNNNSSELDCRICPFCRQVLTEKDFITHKSQHRQDDDFPSLQAISKIIS